MQLVMFAKMVQDYGLASAAATMAELGLEGMDLTVRTGGFVLPENATAELPSAVETVRAAGLSVPMITTEIASGDHAYADELLGTGAQSGVTRYKLGYWPYTYGTLVEQLDAAQRAMDGIEKLAERHGVCCCIHSHSGAFLSGNSTLVWLLLKDRDPLHIGAYLDPGHMIVEGGKLGWMMGLDLLKPYAQMVAVKDFGWSQAEPGTKKWAAKLVPLSEGMVPWPDVFGKLAAAGFDGVVSVHSEYKGGHSFLGDCTTEQLVEQTARDLDYLKPVLTAALGWQPR
ncbi:MAG: sugar phosphate isomerase/epimerase [Armatimonadetes bacterium CG_4_10_14_3_um_filter_66_18]|nr:sugar phosphate isomerase/epimerase [Armatimonadota bacterium]NDK15618.1 sugar phosphate isomerase/epimerase [Armatimonadota bacterium]PIY42890.1 MAG: sugar phosphate isomerase/epimerase [Armatimonadetes bacterium CG_4_10_14_3_um_filter_66_18]PIZ50096.1 MAG: sugar phosphate isomerase/epimerase [Armatimonadetes bacterium CG_4_10_14_0_8_um_filter_66_14]PJB69999.1 MAG: sugar phosphate isomerase/epimerase [Armatimonadetes bacterium CG_4_9_14_3_um_filter_66_14]